MIKKESILIDRLDLSTYAFPEVTDGYFSFPYLNTSKELLEEANKRDLAKGRKKFNQLFFDGGKVEFQDDVMGSWKEKAFRYAKALMGSFTLKHEHKEAVCAMIFEECLVLED